uniref:Uncharacterized protein n=1 Tax=Gopherus evgoodei TaxID=1825980 RepID=A0A8C4WPI8_9SAUR
MASPRILSTVLALLSLLLLLVALGSDHWLVAGSLHEGLWKSCLNSLCGQISSASAWAALRGLRAVPFAPGLCAMIALAVYTGEFAGAVNAAQGQVTFGWSFGLGWASFPLFLITGECNIGECRKAAASGVGRGGWLYRDPLPSAEMQPPLGWNGAGYTGTLHLELRCSHLWGGVWGLVIQGPFTRH